VVHRAHRRAVWVVCAGLVAWSVAGAARAACPAGRARGVRGDHLAVGFVAAPPFVVPGPSDGEVHGLAIDLLRAVAAHEGWELAWSELNDATLKLRLAACELDLGVVGTAASARLVAVGSAAERQSEPGIEPRIELSLPFFSSVTTAIVNADDDDRAAPAAGRSPVGRLAHAALHGVICGAAALAGLAFAAWGLNAAGGFRWTRAARWRRIDAAVSGPWAGLGWLARSVTGRALIALWVVVGGALGASGAFGGGPPPVLRDDPLAALVERAAREDVAIGERASDRAQIRCAASDARGCFRGLADGTLSAIAGPREVLCTHALELSLDDTLLRGDLEIPEQFSFLLPAGSPLRAALDLALLRQHARAPATPVRCPDGAP